MLRKILMATLSLAAFSGAASVNAATFNFVNLIDIGAGGSFSGTLGDGTPDSGTIPTGEAGYQEFTWIVGTVSLTASATKNGDAFAYLDSNTAGLGVCGILNGSNQCQDSSDDNVTLGEVLTIELNETYSIDVATMIFRGANHGKLTNSNLDKVFVNTGSGAISIADLLSGTSSVITGSNFDFYTTDTSQQFYISSLTAVPIPAAAWLFGSALIGLAGVARNRKLS